jgi:hypothetical protein
MEPVVNGLEEDFGSQVEFRRIDANSSDGRAIFQSFSLRGHPSYVLLNPQGEIVWQGLGEQSFESIQSEIWEASDN